jgi:hypothetical protein
MELARVIVVALIAIGITAAVAGTGRNGAARLALVFAATLVQGVAALEARGLGRSQAALATTLSGAVHRVRCSGVGDHRDRGVGRADQGRGEAGARQTGIEGFADLVAAFGSGITTQVFGVFSEFVGLAVAILPGTLLTFYLLKDGALWWDRALAGVSGRRRDPPRRHRSPLRRSQRLHDRTGTIALIRCRDTVVIMVLLGLPLAFPVAVRTFFGNFIPYFGGAITTFIGFLVAVAVGTPTDIALMAIYTLVFNIVQGNFVAPLVYGKTVSLHPAIVLLAIPAGGQIAGIIGMFLIVPFLGVVAVTWRLVLHVFDPDDAPPVLEDPSPRVPDVSQPASVTNAATP